MISFKAACRACVSSVPARRSAAGMLYCALPWPSWSMNQSRCCAKERMPRSGTGTGDKAESGSPGAAACAAKYCSISPLCALTSACRDSVNAPRLALYASFPSLMYSAIPASSACCTTSLAFIQIKPSSSMPRVADGCPLPCDSKPSKTPLMMSMTAALCL
ncbi:hypothetical protein D3C71_981490 [compost metagenome]